MKDKPENILIKHRPGIDKSSPENVVLDEERVSGRFEYKVLHERLGRIVISLELKIYLMYVCSDENLFLVFGTV